MTHPDPLPRHAAPPAAAEPLALMNTKQVAGKMGCCVRHVQNMAKDGRLPAINLGRSVRFDPAAVERFIQQGGTRGS